MAATSPRRCDGRSLGAPRALGRWQGAAQRLVVFGRYRAGTPRANGLTTCLTRLGAVMYTSILACVLVCTTLARTQMPITARAA